ncbi:ATP-dependent Clp protease proteolytic subunit [Pantoea ananatis]|uniref:ATP-dependent Clp protease proteolytic subunit n=1 Tax=Pantoea ananas TaxID=553 RepID=UPI002222F2B7|nr:ATP-dependent Clp protease proteolytic subunit [Pantoea ananatis]MCW1834303.1 ATP-dependent Clp protease proteolytic subunit [Pantoea ananatis]
MKINSLSFSFLALLILPLGVQANAILIKNNILGNSQVKEAGVYFNGAVNNQTVTWLLSALAEIHDNYLNIKNVDIYLNSRGGDMDAGYVAYEALRKSPFKLNMINSSMTGSSATMIYCASSERYSMPMAQFILHPAAASNEKSDYLKPDQARRILEDDNNYNEILGEIYKSCLNLGGDEFKKTVSSESGRMVLKYKEAVKRKLVTRESKVSGSYPVTYYITDNQS